MEDKKDEIIEEFKSEIGCGTFKGKPNYTKLKPISQLLDAMELASPHSALILDFYKHNIHYISPSSLLLCGYDRNEAIKEGYNFYKKIFSVEDLKRFKDLNVACIDFIRALPAEDREGVFMTCDIVLMHKDGYTVSLNRKAKPYLYTDTGDLWMVLCCTNYSLCKETGETYVVLPKCKKRYKYSFKKKSWEEVFYIELTDTEKMVVYFCHIGKTGKEIAEYLSLSIHTVSYYKKQILKKTNCTSMKEALIFLSATSSFK